ncbi:MAG: hypothetical protein JWR22_1291 [Herminiimonas sp.]|nr:hypothetical protein [Herminiimonas sp.]
MSIDAQRRQLQQLATDRGFVITEEFSDVVESGKDELRAGFQRLLGAVRNKRRGWDTLLILDTSRLARRRHISLVFEEVEARKHGVRVVYKSLPDSDPITEMLLKSILQAMDEWHSLTSKQKGLAGMAENVRQGWRAGGRAPMGYELQHVETGAIREGAPVKKSKLIKGDAAATVQAYLKLRAEDCNRTKACTLSGLKSSSSTLVGVEWNALTYAGHTAWNVRYEHGAGGYANSVKRRPRAEWVVQRDTHEPLITNEEAESLLARLEAFDRGHHAHADYILTGLLKSTAGENWRGSDGGAGGYYRLGKGKRIKASIVEAAIMGEVQRALRTPAFVQGLTDAARKQFDDRKNDDAIPRMKKECAELDRRIRRLTEMLADTSRPEPLLRQVEEYEVQRADFARQIHQRMEEAHEAAKVKALAAPQVGKLLATMAEEFERIDREGLRDLLKGLVEQVVLDDTAQTFQITYRLDAATGLGMASPRGFEPLYSP